MERNDIDSLSPLRRTTYSFQARPFAIWLTILLAWLSTLLPWRTPYTPDVLLVVLLFWVAHSGRGVGLVAAFVFGILLDVHDVKVFGSNSLTYIIAAYCVLKIRRRMMHFNVFGQMLYMLPVFVLAQIPQQLVESWRAGGWSGWYWLWVGVFNCLAWLGVHLVFKLPWQNNDDDEAVV